MEESLAQRQLFIGNLPFSIGWQDLKDLFRECGNVVRADIASHPSGSSRGFGTVVMETAAEAKAAIDQFNEYEWNGRQIEVRYDRTLTNSDENGERRSFQPFESVDVKSINSKSLYVGNIPFSVGWQDLKDLFREAGFVQRADILLDRATSRSRGFGTVVMSSVAEARSAVEKFNGYEWHGRTLEVREDRMSTDQHHQQSQRQQTSNQPSGSGRHLFVGNLPFTYQWQHLKDLFRQAGNVQHADIAFGEDGRSRGYGQVTMSTEAEEQAAIRSLNGIHVQGRPITVHYDKYAVDGDGGSDFQVFVGNLPYSVRWQDLKDIFKDNGFNPTHADVLTEYSGRSKGCGIVRFSDSTEAEQAISQLNGIEYDGRALIVRFDKFA